MPSYPHVALPPNRTSADQNIMVLPARRILPVAATILLATQSGLFSSSARSLLSVVCAEDNYSYANYYTRGDDDYYTDDDAAAAAGDDDYNDDAIGDDDAYNAYAAANGDDAAYAYAGDDASDNSYKSFWSDYSVLPRRCVRYNNKDVIVFSTYSNGPNDCSGKPTDTFTVPVITYMSSYLEQTALEGGYNYQTPDSAQYVECIALEEGEYYAQLGCDDSNKQKLAVKLYSDYGCSIPHTDWTTEDLNIDISDLPSISFKGCQACDSAITDDDQYNNYQQQNNDDDANAPMCATLWESRVQCDEECQKVGHIGFEIYSGWNTADKVLMTVLALFGFGVLLGIIRKRRTMSNKERLLEEAGLSSAGLKQGHIIATVICAVFIIATFAMLGIKSMTWLLLLVLDAVLFCYLMKLTVDSGLGLRFGKTVDNRSSLEAPTGEPADLGYNEWK